MVAISGGLGFSLVLICSLPWLIFCDTVSVRIV